MPLSTKDQHRLRVLQNLERMALSPTPLLAPDASDGQLKIRLIGEAQRKDENAPSARKKKRNTHAQQPDLPDL